MDELRGMISPASPYSPPPAGRTPMPPLPTGKGFYTFAKTHPDIHRPGSEHAIIAEWQAAAELYKILYEKRLKLIANSGGDREEIGGAPIAEALEDLKPEPPISYRIAMLTIQQILRGTEPDKINAAAKIQCPYTLEAVHYLRAKAPQPAPTG